MFKNLDVTKILSTKGAALLMSLKDQNNSLVQMILTKDLQIKKLISEIKTSKLYSKKPEMNKTEMNKLKNLLMIKSHHQEYLKRENNDECDDSGKKKNISTNEPLNKQIDELQTNVQTLKSHVNYLNELLIRKK